MDHRVRRRVARALLVVAAVAYCGLIWEAVLGYPLEPTASYLSELAAADQPWRWVFRAGDLVAGSAALAAAVLLGTRSVVGHDLLVRATVAAVGVFGAATIADALLPMQCSPSTDVACAAANAAGALGFAHRAHSVTSTVAVTAAVALALGLVLLGRRRAPAAAWFVGAGASAIVATLALAVLSLRSELLGGDPPGLVQRAQTLTFCLVLLGTNLALRHDTRAEARTPR